MVPQSNRQGPIQQEADWATKEKSFPKRDKQERSQMELSSNGTPAAVTPTTPQNGKNSVISAVPDRNNSFILRRIYSGSFQSKSDYTSSGDWAESLSTITTTKTPVYDQTRRLLHNRNTLSRMWLIFSLSSFSLWQTLWQARQANTPLTTGSSWWPSWSRPSPSPLSSPFWLNARWFGVTWPATGTRGWGRRTRIASVTHQVCF